MRARRLDPVHLGHVDVHQDQGRIELAPPGTPLRSRWRPRPPTRTPWPASARLSWPHRKGAWSSTIRTGSGSLIHPFSHGRRSGTVVVPCTAWVVVSPSPGVAQVDQHGLDPPVDVASLRSDRAWRRWSWCASPLPARKPARRCRDGRVALALWPSRPGSRTLAASARRGPISRRDDLASISSSTICGSIIEPAWATVRIACASSSTRPPAPSRGRPGRPNLSRGGPAHTTVPCTG